MSHEAIEMTDVEIIAEELGELGVNMDHDTVSNLLKQADEVMINRPEVAIVPYVQPGTPCITPTTGMYSEEEEGTGIFRVPTTDAHGVGLPTACIC